MNNLSENDELTLLLSEVCDAKHLSDDKLTKALIVFRPFVKVANLIRKENEKGATAFLFSYDLLKEFSSEVLKSKKIEASAQKVLHPLADEKTKELIDHLLYVNCVNR